MRNRATNVTRPSIEEDHIADGLLALFAAVVERAHLDVANSPHTVVGRQARAWLAEQGIRPLGVDQRGHLNYQPVPGPARAQGRAPAFAAGDD